MPDHPYGARAGHLPREILDPDDDAQPYDWPDPDMSILRRNRRDPPPLRLAYFGPFWARWIADAAKAAAAPPDYVAATLIAATSALIGNARWIQCGPSWSEPPHLWCGVVGESGDSKTPAAAVLLRHVLPELERRMGEGHPDMLRDWKAADEAYKSAMERWQLDVKEAGKRGNPPPLPPSADPPPRPEMPRLVQHDVTIERLAALEACAAPKGVLAVRDELAGFLLGMTTYNDAGRAFWLEAWNGGPFRVERQKHPDPLVIPRHAVAVFGGIQPERLTELMKGADDGLLARFIWSWPDPMPFRLSDTMARAGAAVEALDRLRRLDLLAGDDGEPQPRYVPLVPEGMGMMEAFGQRMQRQQQDAAGLLRSAYGKARGIALRLALVLAYLDWCAEPEGTAEPASVSADAFGRSIDLIKNYFIPMAARVYGDAAVTQQERQDTTLARHIHRHRLAVVAVRELIRERALPGIRDAATFHATAGRLVEAGWLAPMAKGDGIGRPRAEYPVNPALHEAT